MQSHRQLHTEISDSVRSEQEAKPINIALVEALADRAVALGQHDLLLREVYHRVKNNLQVVDSRIMMQARSLEDPPPKKALHDLSGRIFALGLVHQQLMGSENLKTFDVQLFLRELSKNIRDGGGADGINLTVDVCRLEVGLDFAVPLGLVVTELVTNSLKHAFPDGKGNICVTLRNHMENKLVLTVCDDGTTHAEANAPKAGLGTGIIKGLVTQLEGTILERRENGTRTEIQIAMPTAS